MVIKMELSIKTSMKEEMIDITDKVQERVTNLAIKEGTATIQSTHTTAGITINENADPDVKEDILKALSIFDRSDYQHSEGNSSAHVKASLMGNSVSVIIDNGKLQLGTWGGIMFSEFDGPRNRKVLVNIKEK
ncbi:YjbQ family protein [Candidatus Woesearchaeota archaeon]|nr:YjbQ family protein [Candidatus Woesearchaeota archaeon]